MRKIFLYFLFIFTCIAFIACDDNKIKETPVKKIPDTTVTKPKAEIDTIPNAYTPPDVSPMDMTYYPLNYSKLKMAKAISTPPLARVIYSRPHLEGRKLFDGILKYGEPWRLGANEATEITFYSDADIQSKKIKAGRYILYCIPQPDTWEFIFNTNVDTWGLQPDSTKNIARFTVPSGQSNYKMEFFTIMFEGVGKDATLVFAWENKEARLPIRFN